MKKIINEYITNVLSENRSEFGNKAVCPFAKPELETNKLMIEAIGDKSLGQLIDEFYLSDYESALFIIKDNVPANQTHKFQIFVNKVLKTKGLTEYKNICFNPNDEVAVDGYNPRSKAPYFMINIARREVLLNAQEALQKTNYYDKLPEDYKIFLKLSSKSKINK
tara:strand:+ start:2032 stop:2526 length:495 start_codon:yes stop_codon:yes gene_type:complete